MLKVLLADDEVRVCRLIEALGDWQALDMEVCGMAHNGVEALRIIEEAHPDLVITDIRMPGCDGLELISRAKALQPDLEFVIISGYRQFEYAQSAIKYGVGDYLLKPIKKEELTATLQKIRQSYDRRHAHITEEEQLRMRPKEDMRRMRQGFFADCLFGESPPPEDIEELNRRYYFAFKPGVFQVFIVKIDSLEGRFDGEECQVLTRKVLDILAKYQKLFFDSAFCVRDSRVYGVLNYPPEDEKLADKAFRAVMENLNMQKSAFAGMAFTLCVGSKGTSPAGLRRSMEQALDAMGQRLISLGGRVICAEDLSPHAACDDAVLAQFNRDVAAAVDIMDTDKLREAVASFAEALRQNDVGGRAAFEAVLEAHGRFLLLLKNMQLMSRTEEESAAFAADADLCADLAGLVRLLETQIAGVLEDVIDQRMKEEARPVRAAKAFIQENYMHPITLEQVGAHVGFNASYFSTFFKKNCGVGFLEYLSDVRINRAKELLRDTDMNVADICEAVGYADLKHFNRTFKKLTGVKPSEFRKLYA